MSRRLMIAAGLAGVLVAGGASVPAVASPSYDRTSTIEARRVDRVPTPRLAWTPCNEIAECATAALPLDYDQPNGPTTNVAVLRVKARDQAHRIGSLFINPGGPGGSATRAVLIATEIAGDAILDRFDLVGVDPRGIGDSDNLRCFASSEEQAESGEALLNTFPWGRAEERAYVAVAERVGRACSTTGRPLSGAMSTAEVARDMDVIRRAVGDRELSYLGFSYGTELGQTYANMFPDRVRAVVVDGVIDPIAWAGVQTGRTHILDERMHSADGAWRAFAEILKRCRAAGEERCAFAAGGDPARKWRVMVEELRAEPLVVGDFTLTYADLVGGVLGIMYDPDAGDLLAPQLQEIYELVTSRGDRAAQQALALRLAAAREARAGTSMAADDYANGIETFLGVTCTDTVEPWDARQWIPAAERADRRAPYFGRAWSWITAPCAGRTWTVRDEDAYRGPFTKHTKHPVLFVGSFWDPATNYDASVSASRRQPGARLLSSNNWGHTAYGTSACADTAIEAYLVSGALPAKGKTCTDARQPFTGGAAARAAKPATNRLPATPLPKSVLIGTR